MNLDKLAVVLRPRSNWEAIDLGVRMVQSWARPLYVAWLAVYLPLAALMVLAIGYGLELLGWVSVVLWWLKPLFDRVLLFLLAHAVFGEMHDWRSAWRALPGLLWRTGLFRSLTWARFTLMRSFTQPVAQLEGLRGKAARERRQLLARQAGGTASWLLLAIFHFEMILVFALAGLVWLFVPAEFAEDIDFWGRLFNSSDDAEQLVDLILAIVYIAILGFLEPFYVAGGFALYLKRRTDLEAWDVELALRRLTAAAPPKTGALGAALALLIAVALVGAVASPPAHAAATTDRSAQHAQSADPALQASDAIAEVMKRPEFGKERSFWRLKYIGPQDDTEKDLTWLKRLMKRVGKALRMIGKMIAQTGRVVMWIVLGILVALIVWMIIRYWRLHGAGLSRRAHVPPAEVAGFDIRPESLPDDVAAAAMALLQAGEARAALGLLYRAALSALAHRDRVEFNRGDTEGDCLDRVRAAAVAGAGFFEELTRAWQQTAYASRTPPMSHLESLCTQWPQHFPAPR